MNPDQLIKALIEGGIPEDQARAAVETLTAEEPTTVDTDNLTKALEDLRATFSEAGEPEEDVLAKALVDTEYAQDTLVQKLDATLNETALQNEALCKGLLHQGETLTAIAEAFNALTKSLDARFEDLRTHVGTVVDTVTETDEMNKALMDEPLAPRAVQTDADVIAAHPGETPAEAGETTLTPRERADLLQKSIMVELEAADTDTTRRQQLLLASASLDSGMTADGIASKFQITTGA